MEREIRIHIVQNHQNIIKLYAAFEDEKHVYMVQEYAVCGDLFEDLKKGGGQMKEKNAARDVIAPFLSALVYLHAQNIVHRCGKVLPPPVRRPQHTGGRVRPGALRCSTVARVRLGPASWPTRVLFAAPPCAEKSELSAPGFAPF